MDQVRVQGEVARRVDLALDGALHPARLFERLRQVAGLELRRRQDDLLAGLPELLGALVHDTPDWIISTRCGGADWLAVTDTPTSACSL